MAKFSERNGPRRMLGWDYSSPASYFVTICTKDRIKWFGEVNGDKIMLSETGKIAQQCWIDIPKHFSDTIIDTFIVMPDHMHGILQIQPQKQTKTIATLAREERTNHFGPLKKHSLSSIVSSYKAAVSRWCHANTVIDFAWQSLFHEQRIRTDQELQRIKQYILTNPLRWRGSEGGDRLYDAFSTEPSAATPYMALPLRNKKTHA